MKKIINILPYLLISLIISSNLLFSNDEYYLENIKEDEIIEKRNPQLLYYIKNKYEKVLFGLEHLFYPAKNPQKLYIIFNGATKNKYSMWSWFWDNKEEWDNTSFLFLKDDTFRWYIGAEGDTLFASYLNLIKHYIKVYNLSQKPLFTIGGSMGGYAALLYGIKLGATASFAFRPQIDYPNAAGTSRFGVQGLASSWINLNELVKKSKKIPKIYLNYGDYPPDKKAAHQFLDTLKEVPIISIIHKTSHTSHKGFNPSKEFILGTLNYLEKINYEGT